MKSEAIEESYPLSPMQQGILFHAIYAPQSRLYHRQEAWALQEDLNAAAFRQAWLRIVARHPILRTSFRWNDLAAPLQEVHRHVTLPWEAQDWRGFSVTEQDERLAADRKRGCQLDQAPLMRVAPFRAGEADYRFTWIFHHLLLDGGSRQALTQEVFALYEAIRRHRPPRWSPRRAPTSSPPTRC